MNDKTSDENVVNIEDDIKILNKFCEYEDAVVLSEDALEEVQDALQNILAEREQKDKRIKELEEYIAIAPDLDEMTATKYINIQKEAYIRGRAEEQQRAEQIIYEHYIPKQVVIDVLQNNRNELFGMTYLYKEQYRPYEMQIERIKKIEKELLEGERK